MEINFPLLARANNQEKRTMLFQIQGKTIMKLHKIIWILISLHFHNMNLVEFSIPSKFERKIVGIHIKKILRFHKKSMPVVFGPTQLASTWKGECLMIFQILLAFRLIRTTRVTKLVKNKNSSTHSIDRKKKIMRFDSAKINSIVFYDRHKKILEK